MIPRDELVVCAAAKCGTRALRRTAESLWDAGGYCEVCQMSPEERKHLYASIKRAKERPLPAAWRSQSEKPTASDEG